MALLFELPICRQALEKNFLFAMWPSGAGSGGPAAIPAGDRRIPAGGGWGSGLWATRVRFGSSVGGEKLPVGAAPAAGGGGRRGPCCGAAGPLGAG
jgi:hypothetical protein